MNHIDKNKQVEDMLKAIVSLRENIIKVAPSMLSHTDNTIRKTLLYELESGKITTDEHKYILERLGYNT
jgi:hypothetical protein